MKFYVSWVFSVVESMVFMQFKIGALSNSVGYIMWGWSEVKLGVIGGGMTLYAAGKQEPISSQSPIILLG